MELLDRYLQAVRKHLPWQRQDDIIAELRANLESQLDEKQAELSRPLTPAESEAWIRGLGSPVQMASHYQPQQYLIGPAIYPVYLYVLRLASMWAIGIYILVSTIIIVLGSVNADAVAAAALRLPAILIQTAGWITLIFAAIEYVAARHPEKCPPIAGFYAKWSPGDLPPLAPAQVPGRKRRSYAQAVTEAIFGFVFLGWLLLVPEYPFLMFGPGIAFIHASPFHPAPIWMTCYWWIVALNVIQLGWKCIDLLSGAWQRKNRVQLILFKAFGLIPVLLLVNAPDRVYAFLKHPDTDLSRYGQALNTFNSGVHMVLLLVAAIVALQLAWDIGQAIFELWRKRAQA
jgi:hypothetical protein